ncbi:MAG: ABC transporter ATP-binding protein [Prevotella sp.]|nr:ABC transporter ATP-binding protein [Prevotella sp.]
MNVIEIDNLHKSFGAVKAVDGLSFQVQQGELFAFLGINGAGKSTTIGMICGTLVPDAGKIEICGKNVLTDMAAITAQIGVVFQASVLDGVLSVRDNLLSRASLYGIVGKSAVARIKELAELLDFTDLLDRTVGKLSGGQRRRVDVARALLHDPAILILDEPTTGLDPQTRKLLWQVIDGLRQRRGMTVFLTTHYMEETADADNVVILDGGKIVAQGTPIALKNRYTGDFITLYGVDESQVKALKLPYEKLRDGYRIAVKDTAQARDLIVAHAALFRDFEISKGKMDDVFLAVTGKKLEGGN